MWMSELHYAVHATPHLLVDGCADCRMNVSWACQVCLRQIGSLPKSVLFTNNSMHAHRQVWLFLPSIHSVDCAHVIHSEYSELAGRGMAADRVLCCAPSTICHGQDLAGGLACQNCGAVRCKCARAACACIAPSVLSVTPSRTK